MGFHGVARNHCCITPLDALSTRYSVLIVRRSLIVTHARASTSKMPHARRHGGRDTLATALSFADELEEANEKKYIDHVDGQLKEEASSGLAMMARSGGGARLLSFACMGLPYNVDGFSVMGGEDAGLGASAPSVWHITTHVCRGAIMMKQCLFLM